MSEQVEAIRRGVLAALTWCGVLGAIALGERIGVLPVLLGSWLATFQIGYLAALSWGLHRTSRVCAALLLVDVAFGSAGMAVATQQVLPVLLGLPFVVLIGLALRAAIERHAERDRGEPGALGHLAKIVLGLLGLSVVVLTAYATQMSLETPPYRVTPGGQLARRYVDTVRDVAAMPDDERILFFYSDALQEIEEGFYVLTDRRVVLYGADWEPPLHSVPFDEIVGLEVEASESWLDDTFVWLETDDSDYSIPLSTEANGDRRFVDALRERTGASSRP